MRATAVTRLVASCRLYASSAFCVVVACRLTMLATSCRLFLTRWLNSLTSTFCPPSGRPLPRRRTVHVTLRQDVDCPANPVRFEKVELLPVSRTPGWIRWHSEAGGGVCRGGVSAESSRSRRCGWCASEAFLWRRRHAIGGFTWPKCRTDREAASGWRVLAGGLQSPRYLRCHIPAEHRCEAVIALTHY